MCRLSFANSNLGFFLRWYNGSMNSRQSSVVGRGLTTHHAYLSEGPLQAADDLRSFIEKQFDVVARQNPDFWLHQCDVLGVDDARNVTAFQIRMPVGTHKVCVLSFERATAEAQNALLKVLEEPASATYFFLLTPSTDGLLPTLRSRLALLDAGFSMQSDEREAEDFLAGTYTQRTKIIEPLIKDKRRADARRFIAVVARRVRAGGLRDREMNAALEELLKAEQYCTRRAPSLKLILEHLALVVPRM